MPNTNNPVVIQAATVSALIALTKSVLAVAKAFHWLEMDETQDAAVSVLIETALPIIAVLVGALWATRRVTPLSRPRDVDGVPLTRPDNTPAIPEMAKAHAEAVKINESINERGIDRGEST